jgi:hypothetical protein
MTESEINARFSEMLAGTGLAENTLEALAGQLVWRIGRLGDDQPVTVRVGLASSAQLFSDLPRLRNATDAEVDAALQEGSLRIEWIGPRS